MTDRNALLLSIPTSVPTAAFADLDDLYDLVGHNTGNLAFVYAIDQHLGGGVTRFARHEKPEVVNAASESIAVLPCANHLNPAQDLEGEARIFASYEKPMVAIGLGAQGPLALDPVPDLPEGSVRWLREMAERAPGDAPNISVRGEFTQRVLDKYGVAESSVVLGCPSLFINPAEDLGRRIEAAAENPIRRVAVTSGHYRWRHLHRRERSLAQMVEDTRGSYIVQSPFEMIAAARAAWDRVPPEDRSLIKESIGRDSESTDSVEEFYRNYSIAFFDAPAWMNYYRNFDFVVGPRIHGVMLAIQAGVPGMCVAHDSRVLELCETMGVPYVRAGDVADGVDLSDLRRLFKFDGAEFDARRRELLSDYRTFLTSNGLDLSFDLRAAH